MRRSVLVVLLGCGPSLRDGDGDGEASTGATSHAASSGESLSTSGPVDASSSADTGLTADSGVTLVDVGVVDGTTAAPCDPRERCPLPGDAFAEVQGTTPLGEFTGAFAWSGRYAGECGGTAIAITPTLEDFEMDVVCMPSFDPPDPSLYLFIGETLRDDCAIDEPVTLIHTLDGATVETTPQVELMLCEPYDDRGSGRVEGSFTATGDGWSISGTFVAPRCIDLDIACP